MSAAGSVLPRTTLLRPTLFLLATLLAGGSGFAQTDAPPRLQPPAASDPAATGAARLVGGSPRCPDYWVVSARGCQRKANRRRTLECCPFRYYHRHGRGKLRKRTGREFQDWLVPGVPVCIVVHGSWVGWDGMLHDSHQTYLWLRRAAPQQPVQFVFFTWDSQTHLTWLLQVDVEVLGKRAGFNGLHLARLVHTLPAESPVCLLGHSHGARVASSTMHLLSGGVVQGYALPFQDDPRRRVRLVFAAAAVDHDWLNPGQRYAFALNRTEALLNVRNERDLVLKFYPLRQPLSRPALGRDGFQREDLGRLGSWGWKIRQLDVSRLLGPRHVWPFFYRRPQIAGAMRHYVYFDDAAPAGRHETARPSSAPTGRSP